MGLKEENTVLFCPFPVRKVVGVRTGHLGQVCPFSPIVTSLVCVVIEEACWRLLADILLVNSGQMAAVVLPKGFSRAVRSYLLVLPSGHLVAVVHIFMARYVPMGHWLSDCVGVDRPGVGGPFKYLMDPGVDN